MYLHLVLHHDHILCAQSQEGGEEEGLQEDAREEGEPPAEKEKQD
jgi:hypothetical protein